MRTSDGGFAYSSSRLSSLWLPERLKAPLRLCKTVQFSCLLKGVHRWLNTPRWPYQLFYYSRRGALWTRWQKHIFSLKIKRESQPPFGGLMLGDYAKTLGGVSDLRVNKGRFDRAAEVAAFPRSPSKYIFPPHFFVSQGFCALRLVRWLCQCSQGDSEPENREHVFHLSVKWHTIMTLRYHMWISC